MKCGIGDYTAHLAEALASQTEAVGVLTDVAAQPVPPERTFATLPVARGWTFSDVRPLLRAAREWRPEIVHMQFPTQGYGRQKMPWLLPALLRLQGHPVVLTWHEYFQQKTWIQIKGSLLNLPNALLPGGLVVVRPHYLELMAGWYRWIVRRKRFRFIPNASALPTSVLTDDERRAIRARFSADHRPLVVYFGFVYPAKGVEYLFDVVDPSKHHLVLICDLKESDPYQERVLRQAQSARWAGHATITGFQPPDEVSRLLAAADAVLFPFREGGGLWNTSLQGAAQQGTFVLTTSRERHGYEAAHNVYYARPDDAADMRQALEQYLGRRVPPQPEVSGNWASIAEAHLSLYREVLSRTT